MYGRRVVACGQQLVGNAPHRGRGAVRGFGRLDADLEHLGGGEASGVARRNGHRRGSGGGRGEGEYAAGYARPGDTGVVRHGAVGKDVAVGIREVGGEVYGRRVVACGQQLVGNAPHRGRRAVRGCGRLDTDLERLGGGETSGVTGRYGHRRGSGGNWGESQYAPGHARLDHGGIA